VDTVLFDLDGTLIDTRRLYAAAYGQAFVEVLGAPPSAEELRARRPASERIFLVEWYGEAVGGEIHRRMLAHYDAGASTLMGGFFDGIGEMLAAILSAGLRVGIVTGKSRFAFDVTCRHVDLSAFEVVVVEDDVERAKPDPAGIQRALKLLGGGEAVYVGDTPMDVEAAHRAGLRGAAALWAWADREGFEIEPDETVWRLARPSDLVERLGL